MDVAVASTGLVVGWHSDVFDAASLVQEELRRLYGVRNVMVGRLCGLCGSSGHGRPWARVGDQRVQVSWSRSAGHLLTAISFSGPVGVDVESLEVAASAWPLADALAMGEVVTSAAEFVRLWVAKEAILKAHGVGLAEPMSGLRLAEFEGDLRELEAPRGLVAALALL